MRREKDSERYQQKMVKDWIQDTAEIKDNAAFLEGLFFTFAFMER